MLFYERCPFCRHVFIWTLPDKNGMPCPDCKTVLVESKEYSRAQRRLHVTALSLPVLARVGAWLPDRLGNFLAIVLPVIVLTMILLVFDLILGVERFARIETQDEKDQPPPGEARIGKKMPIFP